MSDAERLPDNAVPKLSRGVRLRFDEARESWMLLAPERAVKLDPVAAAILQETDGARNLAQIAQALTDKYNAPHERILGDSRAFLIGLMDKRMAEIVT